MNRDEFMAFFRRDDFHEMIKPHDCIEIFLNVLHGSSDITPELIADLKMNYGVTHE